MTTFPAVCCVFHNRPALRIRRATLLGALLMRKLMGVTLLVQLMDWDEHVMLISHTVNLFSDHILVIGNTGSNSTKEALHATEQGFAVGMHASLQINPYYGKTSMPGTILILICILQTRHNVLPPP